MSILFWIILVVVAAGFTYWLINRESKKAKKELAEINNAPPTLGINVGEDVDTKAKIM